MKPQGPVLCRVESVLLPKRTTPGGYEYHTCQLLNGSLAPIASNQFTYDGLKCQLAAEDRWEKDGAKKLEFGINGIVLSAVITDRLGIERVVLFDNNSHHGQALRGLMAYVMQLGELGTHEAMKEVRRLRQLLADQKALSKKLSEKLQAASVQLKQN